MPSSPFGGPSSEAVSSDDGIDAVAVLGDEKLRLIAQELAKAVRNSVTID